MPPDQGCGIKGGTAGFSPDTSSADVSDAPGEASPAPDPTSKASLVEQLEAVCTDWESESHALALQLTYEAPSPERMEQFKQWLQEVIVTQSEGFAGYRGTLLYTPDGLDAAPPGTKGVFVVEARYSGANNFKAWLEAEERERLMRLGQAAGLFVLEKTTCRILEGSILMIDCVWSNGGLDLEGGAAGEEDGGAGPELAKWKIVLFTAFAVWLAVLLLGWPIGGLTDAAIRSLGVPAGVLASQAVTVALVQWIIIPCLQPLLSGILLQQRPLHWIFHTEPMLTLYEGLPGLRPPRRRGRMGRNDAASRHAGESFTEEETDRLESAEAGEPTTPESVELSVGCDRESNEDNRVAEAAANQILQAVDDTVRSTAREYSQPLVQFNSHISVILKEHVRPERAADFETAINNLGSAANAFTGEAFVGTTVIRPSSGSNVYTVILRFTNKEALERWMLSEERESLVAEKDKCTYSPAEVRASTRNVLDLLLSNNTRGVEGGAGEPCEGRSAHDHQPPPPAKYKTYLIVLASLYAATMTLQQAWKGTALDRLSFPLQSAVKITVLTSIIGYTLVPIASVLLKSWLSLPRPKLCSSQSLVFSPVRWIMDGLDAKELSFTVGGFAGLLVGLGCSGMIQLKP